MLYLLDLIEVGISYFNMDLIKAGIASKASDYFHSNASNSFQNQSLIPVMRPSNPIIISFKKSENDEDVEFW